jgi:hypothetical protein
MPFWRTRIRPAATFRIRASGSLRVARDREIVPQFISGNTQIEWDPIFVNSTGTHLRTHSAFVKRQLAGRAIT